jgi:hypothetical protein
MIMLTLVSLCSIREFCDLSIPIIMFDKDSNYVVMKLEEVSVWPTPYVAYVARIVLTQTSSSHCHSALITSGLRTRQSQSRRQDRHRWVGYHARALRYRLVGGGFMGVSRFASFRGYNCIVEA